MQLGKQFKIAYLYMTVSFEYPSHILLMHVLHTDQMKVPEGFKTYFLLSIFVFMIKHIYRQCHYDMIYV